MPQDDLTHAKREDALFAISYAVRFTSTGKPLKVTNTEQLAARVLEQLERNGFVLMRKQGLPPPGSAPSF